MKTKTDRKLYSLRETYWIFYYGIRTVKYMITAKKNDELTLPKIERIMLAVTEVNGCGICSYAHAKIALEVGMTNEEIQNLLSGDFGIVPKEELTGVVFAQHYADSRGNPSAESWKRLQEEYGTATANGILGAIRGIMIGNAYGIPWSSFGNRFKGKADPRSRLGYEISMMTMGTLLIPLAIGHAFVGTLLKKPIISPASTI